MLILIAISFLAGLATILDPCILPLLPVVLSAGATGGRGRPLGIVTGLILSFSFFTLTVSFLAIRLGFNPEFLRSIAILVLLFLGMLLLVPAWLDHFEAWISRLTAGGGSASDTPKTGFRSGLMIGVSLGLVWTPCAGPILGSVIALSLTGSNILSAVAITLAYALGAGIPLLLIALSGQALVTRISSLRFAAGVIQRVLGVIIILTALALWTGLDRRFQAYVLDRFPGYGSQFLQLEKNNQVKIELQKLKPNPPPSSQFTE